MDELNIMLADRALEPELADRCRAYFHQTKSLRRVKVGFCCSYDARPVAGWLPFYFPHWAAG